MCEAQYYVDPNLPFFQGHFPGYPIFPGVLHVEAMAQTLGLLVKTPDYHYWHELSRLNSCSPFSQVTTLP